MATTSIGNITSQNATGVLAVQGIYDNGFDLEQFASDQSFSMDEITMAETRMGVDGRMVAGSIPSIKPVTLMFEASSPSYESMSKVFSTIEQTKDIY